MPAAVTATVWMHSPAGTKAVPQSHFYYCDKIPSPKTIWGERVYVAYSFRLESITVGTSSRRELEATGLVFIMQSRSECLHFAYLLTFSQSTPFALFMPRE